MLKLSGIIFLIIFICLGLIILDRVIQKQLELVRLGLAREAKKEQGLPERIGERIVYEVRLGAFKAGRAEFNHLPPVELNGKKTSLITFYTKLTGFNDLEKIYTDPESFLPLRVERDVYAWPTREKISENYDQKNFLLTVTKFKGNKKEEVQFRRNSPIHNAILLPFYVRQTAELKPGWILQANLPTQQFEIRLVNIEEVKVPAGNFQSYHFKSTPNRFEIWISADERRIPLKIKGSGGIGYVMLMKEYSL
jgi:hypothetical protein